MEKLANSFTYNLIIGCFFFICVIGELSKGNTGWATFYGVVTAWALYNAWSVANTKPLSSSPEDASNLTPEQRKQVYDLSKDFSDKLHALLAKFEEENKQQENSDDKERS